MRVQELRPVFESEGPFVTVHTEVGRTDESARQALDARWTTIRHDLEHQGVPPEELETIGERLLATPDVAGEARLTLVSSAGRLVLDSVQEGHSAAHEQWEASLLPDLSGWLAGKDGQLPFCLVVVDRTGADIDFFSARNQPGSDHATVAGQRFHITKVHAGGWSERRFQETAENAWKANAREVADEVRSGLRQHAAGVVVLAGDDRMRAEVSSALEGLQVDLVQTDAGGRAAGASQEALWADVDRILAAFVADEQAALVERLRAGLGQQGAVTGGLDAVLDALVAGRVETLVLDLDAARGAVVRPADHPGLTLPASVGDAKLPADRVLVAAAALTDASLALLPASLTGGTGIDALLRWSS